MDDVALSGIRLLENRVTIGISALFFRKGDKLLFDFIISVDGYDGIACLCAVCPDILHCRCSDFTRNTREVFNAPQFTVEECFNAIVAGESGPDVPHFRVDSGYKIPAAWLIDQCGWKGYSEGNVAVWHLQPLVIVNPERKASPCEVIALEKKIIDSVRDKFGIKLSPEVEHI